MSDQPIAASVLSPARKTAKRRGLRALGGFVLASTFALAAYAQSKIAVIDTQRAMMETEDGLRMQATLKKLFDSKQRELDAKQKQLEQERADIEKQRSVLSQDALQRQAEAWQRAMVELQQMYVGYNQELQKKQGELTQPIYTKTMGLIRRLATQEGFDIIVDKQAVPYSRSDLDVTDRVITMYNGGTAPAPLEEGGAKPAPAAPAAPGAAPKAPGAAPKAPGAAPKAPGAAAPAAPKAPAAPAPK